MSGSSYLPGEAVFLPASMATTEAGAAFNQPDLPPATTVQESSKKSVAKSKTVQANANGKKTKAVAANAVVNNGNGGLFPADLVIPPVDLGDPSEMLNKAAADALQPFLETYGDTAAAAVASAAVDLDSETDSNHDTALTLACAGGHEELVTLLINRGANIGKKCLMFIDGKTKTISFQNIVIRKVSRR